MRFRMIALLPLIAALTLGACMHRHPHGRVSGYSCSVTHRDARGRVEARLQLDRGGQPQSSNGSWERRTGAVRLQVTWGFSGGTDISDDSLINVTVTGERRHARLDVSIRIRREGSREPGLVIPVSVYDLREWGTNLKLGELRAVAPGGRIEVAAIDAKGRVLGQGIFDSAQLGEAEAMEIEVQAALEAMRGDYQIRCQVTQGWNEGGRPEYSCTAEVRSPFGILVADRDIEDSGEPAPLVQQRWYRHWQHASLWASWQGAAIGPPPDTARVEIWLRMPRPPSGVDRAVLRLEAAGDPGGAISSEPLVFAEFQWRIVELITDWGHLRALAGRGPLTITARGPGGEVLARADIDRAMIETPAGLTGQLRAALDARLGQWRRRCRLPANPPLMVRM